MDPVAEIKKLYYGATRATIRQDVDRAIDLLKTLPSDEERERAAVYMDGLAQMRSEWAASARPKSGELRRDRAEAAPGRDGGQQATYSRPRTRASGPPGGAPRAGSGRSIDSFFTSLSVRRFIRFMVSATGVLEFFTRLSTTE